MSAIAPHIHGNINVTWNVDGSVNQITYGNRPLIDKINARLQIQLTPQGLNIPNNWRGLIEQAKKREARLLVNALSNKTKKEGLKVVSKC
jgi:hypothetical protein